MIRYKFIGWCKEGVHDKVWGVIYLGGVDLDGYVSQWGTGGRVLVFWGRRGKKLQCQIKYDNYEMYKLVEQKREKYTEIRPDRLNEVYPEFESDLEKTAFWAELSN